MISSSIYLLAMDCKKKKKNIFPNSYIVQHILMIFTVSGIPAALRQSGFLTGAVLLVLVAIITDYTVILLIKDAFLANKFSYQEMVTAAFGRPGYWYLTFAQFFFPFFGKSLTYSYQELCFEHIFSIFLLFANE